MQLANIKDVRSGFALVFRFHCEVLVRFDNSIRAAPRLRRAGQPTRVADRSMLEGSLWI